MLRPEATPGSIILLVEDNELVMEMTREILECSGYKVVPTYLPSVALKNGPELYRRLQKLLPELPVLYMSGFSNGSIQKVMQGEQAGFLAKPFTPVMLLEQVARILAD